MTYLLAFVASFAFVGLKAMQQLNVVHGNKAIIVPTSVLMACCEVFTIGAVAVIGWGWIVLPVGVGAGLGCLAAMWGHKRFVEKRGEEE